MRSDTEVMRERALPRGFVIIVGIAAALVAALGLREFADVIAPVFLALILSIVVHPIRGLAARYKLPGWLGAVFSLIGVYAIVGGLFAILVVAGIQFADLVESYGPQFQEFMTHLGEQLEALGVSQQSVQTIANGLNPGKMVTFIGNLIGGLAGALSDIVFVVVLLFFTVTDAGSFATKLGRVSPRGQRLADAFELFAHGTRQYLAVATIFGLIVALIDVVALWILDIRYAWLWGLLAFITNYIPNVGFVIGLIPPTIIALLDHDVGTALAVVAIYCVVNFIIQTVIQPRVVGNTVGLSGTLSFLSLIVWTTILGGTAALMAVPLSLFVKSLLVDVDPERRWLSPLLSSDDVTEEPSELTRTETVDAEPTIEPPSAPQPAIPSDDA